MPGVVTSQMLSNLATQLVGPTPPTAENSAPQTQAKRPPPEYAMAAWWKKQNPKMTDQQAWEMGQATLEMARKQGKNAQTPDAAAAKQLALGLYMHHGNPEHYFEPTMDNLLGGMKAFGPQPPSEGYAQMPDYGPSSPSPVLQSFADNSSSPVPPATTMGRKY